MTPWTTCVCFGDGLLLNIKELVQRAVDANTYRRRWLEELHRREAVERRLRCRELELERIRSNFYEKRVREAIK